MVIPIEWKAEYLDFIVAVACVSISFVAYFFISHDPKKKKHFFDKYGDESGAAKYTLYQRYVGFFCMGVIPFIIALSMGESLSAIGISTMNIGTSAMWVGALGIVIILINFINAPKPKSLEQYPQIRTKVWSKSLYYENIVSWMLYLIAYEILFRGIFLFMSVRLIGAWPAIVLNACIYALVHIPKGMKETIGSFPLGTILCVLTFQTGTIWIALFVHFTLAISNTILAFRAHPEMSLEK